MTEPALPDDRLIGGRYRLHHQLGRGGMAVVWAAHDEILGRDVAVKEILPPRDLSADRREEIRQRAMREARAAARLTHPSVVTIYDVVEDGGRPWIVMELLRSRTLADALAADGPLAPPTAARLGADLLDALRTAHHAGVLHRDVKPSNVMLADDGRAVLTDFGIATVEEEPSLTVTGMLVGSPGYMAPERARGERPTPASDLWSLGATLFAATEGAPPFEREGQLATLHAVITEPAPPAVHAGALQPIIARLLDRDPARRPSADEAYDALRLLATGSVGTDGASAAVPPGAGLPDGAAAQAATEVLGRARTTTRVAPPPPVRPATGLAPASAAGLPPDRTRDLPLFQPPVQPPVQPRPHRAAPGRRAGAGTFLALALAVAVVAAVVTFLVLQATTGSGGGPSAPSTTAPAHSATTSHSATHASTATAPTTTSSAPTTTTAATTTTAPTTPTSAPPSSSAPATSPPDTAAPTT